MAYIILALFILTLILCYLEDYIKEYKNTTYFIIGVGFILLAGFRVVGTDPDSDNYEYYFHHVFQASALGMMEPSFKYLCIILGLITDNVHILFLVYAIIGVSIKLYAFKRLAPVIFVPLLFYISFYFELHEMTQMRAGIVSGLYLLALKHIGLGERKKAALLILIGTFFHYSSLVLLPVIFLNNQEGNRKHNLFWLLLIPFGYVVYWGGVNILLNPDIPYIGQKLAIYQTAVEKGRQTVDINIFDPLHLMAIILFYYTYYFRESIKKYCPEFIIVLKATAIGLFAYSALAFLPVLALRVSQLYCVANIILYTGLVYTLKQRWAGITLAVLLAGILLYVSLPHYGLVEVVKNW